MRPIALIGYRGAGKTATAQAIAQECACDVADTDAMIVAQVGKPINQIFDEEGEVAFRRYECKAVVDAIDAEAGVISVGGGAVLEESSRVLLRERCFVVWLTAPADVLWGRIAADPLSAHSRPALTDQDGRAEVESVLSQRTIRYTQTAHAIVDTTRRNPVEVAREVLSLARGGGEGAE